ncbi:hypothetical protein SCLCIDRAFT_691513 [Scleroderma citrinum Foug A]|uniref:Uncharacterized protein n=1 Tax=Scleroderma citrinum Foug A TaxID=1036808 RepID=A0A0C2ZQI5_9AGAM|nr:hypothetical protein SCLCIDRAFT_691513 [Scleroderma citrinum Foug A]
MYPRLLDVTFTASILTINFYGSSFFSGEYASVFLTRNADPGSHNLFWQFRELHLIPLPYCLETLPHDGDHQSRQHFHLGISHSEPFCRFPLCGCIRERGKYLS